MQASVGQSHVPLVAINAVIGVRGRPVEGRWT